MIHSPLMSVKVVTCQSADFHVRSRLKRFLDDQQSFFPCQARPDEMHHPLLLPVPHGWRRPSSTANQFR